MVLLLRLDSLCSVSVVHYTCQCSMRHIPKGCFQLVTSPRTASLLALYLSKHLDAFQVAADCALQVHGFLTHRWQKFPFGIAPLFSKSLFQYDEFGRRGCPGGRFTTW